MSGDRPTRARLAGRITQGVVLGTLLFVALVKLLVSSGGLALFKYQGF